MGNFGVARRWCGVDLMGDGSTEVAGSDIENSRVRGVWKRLTVQWVAHICPREVFQG